MLIHIRVDGSRAGVPSSLGLLSCVCLGEVLKAPMVVSVAMIRALVSLPWTFLQSTHRHLSVQYVAA